MNREIIEILIKLKENPSSEKVDHILLLQKIYSEYANGIIELKPIAVFYLNGFDDLPALIEKHPLLRKVSRLCAQIDNSS
jgi:hypothetical protein